MKVDGLCVEAELFKTEGSADQVLSTSPASGRRIEVGTRYFVGDYRGRRCFVKQYLGDVGRAERESSMCARAGCRQIVPPLFLHGDAVGFEYVQGIGLSRRQSVPNPGCFLKDFARGVYEICSVLKIGSVYDFHTNNVIVRDDGTAVFVDFDLKAFPAQEIRIRDFMYESLGKARVSRFTMWRLAGRPVEHLGARLLRRYLRKDGEAYGRRGLS